MMKSIFVPLAVLLLAPASWAQVDSPPHWTSAQLAQLALWRHNAPAEALSLPRNDIWAAALQSHDIAARDKAATDAALELARAYLFGCTQLRQRAGWQIESDDADIDLTAWLKDALESNQLDKFYQLLRPRHQDYESLRQAFGVEPDFARRATLARNMERWRWMPLELGNRYLLVNTAAFEVGLWENDKRVQTWPVIVGKARTPTTVFAARVTGVTYNPWWDVPKSIVAESVGALTRNNPTEARRRGYVWGNGSYRQRPGPTNALGRMKLVMPNPFSVYLHDTPNKALFEKPARSFSHGCIRVGDALNFAATLLAGDTEQVRIKTILAGNATTLVPLTRSFPVYVTYFTAGVSESGSIIFYDDHYGRDKVMGDAKNPVPICPA